MNRWRWAYAAGFAFIVALELIALARPAPDDTVSEWFWSAYDRRHGVMVGGFVAGFLIWLLVHLLRGRHNNGREPRS